MQIVRSKSKRAAMILPVVPSAIKERSIVKTGDVFIRSWMIERMPRSVQVEETQYESWVDGSCFEFWWEASNADANEIEHELGNLGWLFFSTGSVIETSAFGCDSSVLGTGSQSSLTEGGRSRDQCGGDSRYYGRP